jgi:hypothetical protein
VQNGHDSLDKTKDLVYFKFYPLNKIINLKKPFGLCFGIIPTCQTVTSTYHSLNENLNSTSNYNKYSYSNFNTSNNNNLNDSIDSESNPNKNNDALNNNNGINSDLLNANGSTKISNSNLIKYDSLRLCQITGLNEAKVYNFTNNQNDMIVNFDFFIQNGNY